ncbi:capsule polysaccharide biosynthesis protein [Xylariaceae sp. FL1019]|nr:capsule polysaccharide biosynthesis protein [Xylariaceae sp. FL1019]
MASAAGAFQRLSTIAGPVILPAIAYGAYKGNAAGALQSFFTGPGRTSRIVALLVVWWNWKSLPLAWTTRVFNAMISHFLIRRFHNHSPDKLFHPVVTQTHVTLLEVDYNIHKSNSTYFADLDVSRSHLVSHLFAKGCRALGNNASTKIVMDPSDPSRPAKGKFGVMLGGVQCSFKKEIQPFQNYEMWSRVLSWDRKWMYIVTHFVEKGASKPRKDGAEPMDWQKKVFASAVSKYVFKIGRLTIHPAVVIGASDMLPERPGGWVAEENGFTTQPTANGHTAEDTTETWDWKRTEAERVKGLEYAIHLASLDGLLNRFDPAETGPLGKFALG